MPGALLAMSARFNFETSKGPFRSDQTTIIPFPRAPQRNRVKWVSSLYGGYSSVAERQTVALDVVGSTPTTHPKFSITSFFQRAIADRGLCIVP